MRRPRADGDGGGIDLSAACGRAMALLSGGTRTIEEASAAAGIGARTAGLVADAMSRNGATAEGGWESLPDAVRFSAIKAECYPHPPRDAWILARLAAEGAEAPEAAVHMPADRSMRGLVAAGHVRRAGGRFYLDGIGASLARGVLSMYPELGKPAYSRHGGARRLARRLVGAAGAMAPPAPAAGWRRRAHAR